MEEDEENRIQEEYGGPDEGPRRKPCQTLAKPVSGDPEIETSDGPRATFDNDYDSEDDNKSDYSSPVMILTPSTLDLNDFNVDVPEVRMTDTEPEKLVTVTEHVELKAQGNGNEYQPGDLLRVARTSGSPPSFTRSAENSLRRPRTSERTERYRRISSGDKRFSRGEIIETMSLGRFQRKSSKELWRYAADNIGKIRNLPTGGEVKLRSKGSFSSTFVDGSRKYNVVAVKPSSRQRRISGKSDETIGEHQDLRLSSSEKDFSMNSGVINPAYTESLSGISGGYDGDYQYACDNDIQRSLGDDVDDELASSSSDDTVFYLTPEKKNVLVASLSKLLSVMYALFVVFFSVAIVITPLLINNPPRYKYLFNSFFCAIFLLSILWLSISIIRIRIFLQKTKEKEIKNKKRKSKMQEAEVGDEESAIKPNETMELFGFQHGRHAGSTFLKFGAAFFCFGNMIHQGLLYAKAVETDLCIDFTDHLKPLLHFLFSFLQLFYIFKRSNVIINQDKALARFGMMHVLATNLCVWFETLIHEAVVEIYHDHDMTNKDPLIKAYFKAYAEEHDINVTESMPPTDPCDTYKNGSYKSPISEVEANIAIYLYPLTIEYSLISAGIFYMMWHNVGKMHLQCQTHSASHDHSPLSEAHEADCHATHKGLFSGLFILAMTFISIIVFFVFLGSDTLQDEEKATITNYYTEISLNAVSGICCMMAFFSTSKMHVDPHAIKFLDDFLLLIPLPAYYLVCTFGIIAIIFTNETDIWASLTTYIIALLQVTVQTTFIMDALRRCSNTAQLRRVKPGRGLVMFLLLCNVCLWLVGSFEIKEANSKPIQTDFFNYLNWVIISNLCVPLMIFYRFHSAACLADIWQDAYAAADETCVHEEPDYF